MIKNLYFRDPGVVRHEFNMGMSGSGKTTYIKSRIAQQIKRGGGLTCVDAKLDYEFLQWLYSMCVTYNRKCHLRIINIDDSANSHTYNPLLTGDAEAVTSRFSNVVQTKSNAQAEHFKSMMTQALTPTVDCIKQMDIAYNAMDLFILMTNPTAMTWLLANTPESEARRNFQIHLNNYQEYNYSTKRVEINLNRLRSQVGGAAARLYPYGSGHLGKIMGSYNPELNLLDAIDNCLITYIMLPTMEKKESSSAFATLFLSDFISTVALMYKRHPSTLPIIPHEFYGDEFGSWAVEHVEEGFEKFRGANIALSVSFQTAANLLNLGEGFADKVIGNCNLRNFMQLGDNTSRVVAADIVGQILKKFRSESKGVSVGEGNKKFDWQVFHNISQSETSTQSAQERYDYLIRPEEFGELDVGTMYSVPLSAKQCFKLQDPIIEPRARQEFSLTRYATPARTGLNLADRFNLEFSEQVLEEE